MTTDHLDGGNVDAMEVAGEFVPPSQGGQTGKALQDGDEGLSLEDAVEGEFIAPPEHAWDEREAEEELLEREGGCVVINFMETLEQVLAEEGI